MARGRGRRGRVYEELSRLIHGGVGAEGARLVIEERGGATGLREVPVERVARLARGYLVLDDGTVIPLHRVVAVVTREGGRRLLRVAHGEGEGEG